MGEPEPLTRTGLLGCPGCRGRKAFARSSPVREGSLDHRPRGRCPELTRNIGRKTGAPRRLHKGARRARKPN